MEATPFNTIDDAAEHDEGAIVSPQQYAVSASRGAFERGLMHLVGSTLERTSWEGCRRLGASLGLLFFAGNRSRRNRSIANVQMALSVNRAQAIRIARRATQNWGMTSCEFLHLPAASERDLGAYVSLDGLEHLQSAAQEGTGVILMTAHFGNWELLAARLAQEFAISAIMRPLEIAAVTEHMTSIRRGKGLKMISKHAAARPALRLLSQNGMLYVLVDRHAGLHGALLPFFGKLTSFEIVPAWMAVVTNAPIVPVYGVRRQPWLADGRIEGRILPSFKVRAETRKEREAATIEGTRQVIASVENMVRARPDQWSWMLRRWRDTDVPPAVEES